MKKPITVNGREVFFYSMNLCSQDDVGDYELFPSEPLNLDMEKIRDSLTHRTELKASKDALQFTQEGTRMTLYREGRMILEGLRPDTHEAAFSVLEAILAEK